MDSRPAWPYAQGGLPVPASLVQADPSELKDELQDPAWSPGSSDVT